MSQSYFIPSNSPALRLIFRALARSLGRRSGSLARRVSGWAYEGSTPERGHCFCYRTSSGQKIVRWVIQPLSR